MKKKHTKNEKLLIELRGRTISLSAELYALDVEIGKLEIKVAEEALDKQVSKHK